MQNTITARRVSYNLVALMVGLVAIATVVGFVAGFAVGKPSGALSSAVPAPPKDYAAVKGTQLEQDNLRDLFSQVPTIQTNSPALAQPNAPTSGWVNYQDRLTAKWYSVHYSITPSGPVIDDQIELSVAPGMESANQDPCGLIMTPNIPC